MSELVMQGTPSDEAKKSSVAASLFKVAFLVVALDQLSKWLVQQMLQPGELRPVVDGYFNLTLTYNKGVAFGLLANLPESIRVWVLVGGTLVALLLISTILVREYRGDVVAYGALAAIIGGAIGNMIDRVTIGAVVDFLDFYAYGYHWPAFNIADSAICIGVALLLVRPSTAVDGEAEKESN